MSRTARRSARSAGKVLPGPNPIRVGLALTYHMEHHALDCFFCEQTLESFAELAEHVKRGCAG
jgi:hypothetical protein